uniref:NADH dehydrogenase subunit 2 n=1 Tax=Iheyomytilidicola lauensis TaxID=998671 RepID=UPI001EDE9597|nr:NADH dehydrogenase subunit 2 [Iheyomytilidicola lauensis]UJV31451.1 NADH dehydrogenase subunit 2 [Iheyomytilidicola lauensis]
MNTTIVTLFFSFFMVTLSVISLTVPNWLYVWVIMEIMTALMIFFTIKTKVSLNFEAVMKFFLHQSMAAILLLMLFPLLNNSMHSIKVPIMILCLILYKMGLPPFHFWALQIIPSLDWTTLFMFFTVLKIPPLILLASLTQLEHLWHMVMLITLTSMLLSLTVAINTSQFRVIMLSSSIASSQWVLASILFSQMLGYMYLLTYLLVTTTALWILLMANQSTLSSNYMNTLVLSLTLVILTSASIPPFCLFFAKLESIIVFSYTLPLYLNFIFILSSSLATVFYCNLLININWQQMKQMIIMPTKLSACILLALSPLVPMIT